MRTTNWDSVITSAPGSKQAAIVRDGVGEQGLPVSLNGECFEGPPKMRLPVPSHVDDLTGRIFDRLTVVGLLAKRGKERWVVRCTCGLYAVRYRATLLKQTDEPKRCRRCVEEAKSLRGRKKAEKRMLHNLRKQREATDA